MSQRKRPAAAKDPPEVIELFQVIASMRSVAHGFDGVILRSVAMKYANQNDFFSGVGAAKTGGRWNRVGLQAIYASLDVITATKEAYQNFVAFGFSLTSIRPRVTAGASVSLGKVLDVSDKNVCFDLGFTLQELIEEDWRSIQSGGDESWTQAIGRGCHACGLEGLIVPSAQHEAGKNIVIFPGNLAKSSKIHLLAADQLPSITP
ncbi:RES family NAD+ phosphorylase [Novipirellula sp.]|uniref:RES family NAD+ phosphorylase n=1 Tax=Novipirellula sp. TaxID=2795430 RepID=UPI0035655B91